MESKSISLIEEEIFYYSNTSNFRVCSIKTSTPKKIYKSFTPLSSNQKISFSNTIMIPSITTEFQKEKDNHSSKKDSTGIKTESSKDENNTMSIEKQSTKIIRKSDIEENELNNNILSKNPYFLGKKYTFDITKYNNTAEIETKKVKKFLKQNKNQIIPEKNRLYKHSRKQSCNFKNQDKIKNNITKVKTFDINKLKSEEKRNKNKKIYNIKHSEKNLPIRNDYNLSPHQKKREKTVIHRNSLFKDKKIKESKKDNKRGNILYKGTSHKLLLMGLNLENKDEKNNINNNSLKKKISKTKDNINLNNIDHTNSKIKKVRTTINLNNNKILNNNNTPKKSCSKFFKSIDFDSALKNKNNLGKTQFNLFSPDKFTNTEFCDSDYCEYTLNCMDLIIKGTASRKQEKPKVNFNFPKSRLNSLKKKIALFDLDETLVHCTGDINTSAGYQHSIDIILPGNKETKVGINIRPLWKKTLNLIRRHYHIIIFTASHQAYADAVLNFMDPTNKYFKYRLYRNNCSLVDVDGVKFYVKDLDIFDAYYDLKDIIIVDNSVLSFIYHFANGIPIVPYYNEDKDGSLYVVGLYLMHIFKENDLREANKKYINLESFLNEVKTRQDIESPNNQELFVISTNNNNKENSNNEVINKDKDNNNEFNKEKENEKEKLVKVSTNRTNTRRCSFSLVNTQNKLISKSKLINMYYELNNKSKCISDKNIKDIIEEKSNKSFSVEDAEEIQENEDNEKNIEELFYRKKLLTAGDEPIKIKVRNKSEKNLNNFFDVKMIRSNFYNNFSKQCI